MGNQKPFPPACAWVKSTWILGGQVLGLGICLKPVINAYSYSFLGEGRLQTAPTLVFSPMFMINFVKL